MAVDLSDLIPSLEAETSPPGTDLFPDATDDAWLQRLENAFWEAKLFGFPPFQNYTESDGTVLPISGTDDLPREEQQLLVLFAAFSSVQKSLMNTNTAFSAKAGSVEFSTQNSANLLTTIANQLQSKIDLLLSTLAKVGRITDGYLDAVAERSVSLGFGDISWTGASSYGYGF